MGVVGRAIIDQRLELKTWNPRDFTEDQHPTVDHRPYGGGPGMVMKVEPLKKSIEAAQQACDAPAKVIYLSPQGRRLDQQGVNYLSQMPRLILLAGRYEGVDERLLTSYVDEEWSIGDYVISGGEFAALVVVDAITRLIPGVLGDDESALQDSFMQGLLDYPHYTRPETINGQIVPQVLLSGDHKAIQDWRLKQALGRTWLRRPDLLDAIKIDDSRWDEEKAKLLAEFKDEYQQ